MRTRTSALAALVLLLAATGPLAATRPLAAAQAPQAAKPEGQAAKPEASAKAEEPKWSVNAPPGEPSTVTLDTRTGTWMSVDVSPDGKTLVFDLLGDLYTLPIEGGEASSLTHGIAWDMQARFSPDGKRVAYLSDAGGGDNVWTMDVDGKNAVQVTKEDFRLVNNPVWHPGGEYIAARKHYTGTRSLGSGEIWLYHRSGGKGIALNEKPNWQKDLGEPAFSPDGRYLYFSQDTSPGRTFQYNRNARGEIYSIQRLDLEKGTSEAFVTGPGGAVRPVPSPDGKTLAFVRRLHGRSALFAMDLASAEERPVFEGLERDLQEAWAVHGVYPAFAWTPDSREIVVWAQGKLWRVPAAAGGGAAREIPFHVKDTREVRKALRFATAVAPDRFDVRQLRWATVSPDGSRVVYSALGRLYLKDMPAGAPRRLTKADDRFELFPSFSRDGARVVFTTWNDASAGGVRTLELASGKETLLTKRAGLYLEPRFSPDGKSVVYRKSRGSYLLSPWPGGERGIYRVASDGSGEPSRITREGSAPQFGASNDRVYVTRNAVNNEVDLSATLVSLSLDGNDARELVKTETATEFAVSPDGRWLAFAEGYQAFVAALPLAGKRIDLGPKAESLPLRRLSAVAGEYLHWSGDSRRVHYTLGDELFTTGLEQSFAFVPGAPAELPKPPEQGLKIGFTADADKPRGEVALVGARIVTMRGDEVIEDGVVLVRDNRIVAVGPRATVQLPAGARSVDVKGKTIVPGLVDAHWHGAMGEDEVIPQQSWIDYASLALGVTTLHDPSNDTSEIFSHAELQRAGLVVAPRIFSTGTILYGAKNPATATVNNLADATAHLKRLRAGGAFSVKSYNQPRREQRQQILEAARQTRMLVVPEGGSLFQLNMNQVVDGHTGIEHSLPVPNVYDDVKQLWSQTDVGYTPTLGVAYGGLDGDHYFTATTDVWKHPLLSRYVPRPLLEARTVRRETAPDEDWNVVTVARAVAELSKAGVKVNIGAHGQREGLAAHWEMWMMVKGGMTPHEALRAATWNGARYLGLDADIGSLEPGKLADLVVIDGDVLRDIRVSDRVAQVMVGGRLYDSQTMNELGASPRERRPFFFERAVSGYVPLSADAKAATRGACDH
jgi:imidazolonepropionase-like amidohydrolase/Tol biopolymer transport system component